MSPQPPAADAVLIVCTRSRAALLERCLLPSLADAVDGYPVVVVDQSTDDATAALLEPVAGVSRITSPPGLSRGRNAGIEATEEPIVAFTDDDVTLPPGWLARIAEIFRDDPEVAVVCGRAVTPEGVPMPGAPDGRYRWPTSPFGLASGFNMAFRRSALDTVGPFDEELGAGTRIGAGEDTDMLYRLLRAGFAVDCRSDITVVHDDWRTGPEEVGLHFRYGQGVGAQTIKHLRDGDREALRIGLRTAARQLYWMCAWIARGRWSALRRHPSFVGGMVVGAARRWRQGAVRAKAAR